MTKASRSSRFWTVFLVVSVIVFTAFTHMAEYEYKQAKSLTELLFPKTGTKCGTVLDVSDKIVYMKHGTTSNFYVVVKHDDGTTKAYSVSPTEFFTTKPGDRRCFRYRYEPRSFFDAFSMVWNIMLWLAVTVAVTVVAVRKFNKFIDSPRWDR